MLSGSVPQTLYGLGLGLAIATAIPAPTVDAPLRLVAPSTTAAPLAETLGLDEWLDCPASNRSTVRPLEGDRLSMIQAIDDSLRYLATPAAIAAYDAYPIPAFTHARVRRSLERFRQLLTTCLPAAALQETVQREFELYQSIGQDGAGTVAFTGYFEPTYAASTVPTAEFRFPLYRVPPGFDTWPLPHPTRLQLEGLDGLQAAAGPLRGMELVWLRDRLEAYLVQVQGSARLQLTDGRVMTVGYDGRTDYPYVSLGRELINDGRVAEESLSLPVVLEYFRQHPDQIDSYIARNNRFVFFRETDGAPPTGSLSVPVTPERSIATDKTLMPPGALALIDTVIPYATPSGQLELRQVSRYVLDHDTGGAIRGPGRVDVFMGSGSSAGDRAGLMNHTGQLYYLLLREPSAHGRSASPDRSDRRTPPPTGLPGGAIE